MVSVGAYVGTLGKCWRPLGKEDKIMCRVVIYCTSLVRSIISDNRTEDIF